MVPKRVLPDIAGETSVTCSLFALLKVQQAFFRTSLVHSFSLYAKTGVATKSNMRNGHALHFMQVISSMLDGHA
jgi:hypothetical protein